MNTTTIYPQNYEMQSLQWESSQYPSYPNFQTQNYNAGLQQQMDYPPNQMINFNAAILQQQIGQLAKQITPAMNFPPILPCNKPDPFKLRNNKMVIEHTYYVGKHQNRAYTIKLSNDQYYKIELLRIKMLNHIAQCNHQQCESFYAAHIDDGRLKCISGYMKNIYPAPPPILIGYKRGLHCGTITLRSYCLLLVPHCWICLIESHFQSYDVSKCQEAIILNNESIELQLDANPNYLSLCNHHRCCKYTGQRK